MTSPKIKILISLACVATLYAFACDIRMFRKAGKLRKWVEQERSQLWAELNFFARNWNGGYPGLKVLYRMNVVGLPWFDQQFEQLRALERKLFWGLTIGCICIGLVIVGSQFWGWQW